MLVLLRGLSRGIIVYRRRSIISPVGPAGSSRPCLRAPLTVFLESVKPKGPHILFVWGASNVFEMLSDAL